MTTQTSDPIPAEPICPTCQHPASEHRRLVNHEIKGDDDVTVTMTFDEADGEACERFAADIYRLALTAAQQEIARLTAENANMWDALAQANAERDALAQDAERLRRECDITLHTHYRNVSDFKAAIRRALSDAAPSTTTGETNDAR